MKVEPEDSEATPHWEFRGGMSEYGCGYEDGYDGCAADAYMYDHFQSYVDGYQDGQHDREKQV